MDSHLNDVDNHHSSVNPCSSGSLQDSRSKGEGEEDEEEEEGDSDEEEEGGRRRRRKREGRFKREREEEVGKEWEREGKRGGELEDGEMELEEGQYSLLADMKDEGEEERKRSRLSR